MHADAIARDWQRAFGVVAPIAHLCRPVLNDRWLRIHSLPNSKRYASSPDEYHELFARQNAVATGVLGSDAECVLFFCEFPGEPASLVTDLLPSFNSDPIWLPELASLTKDHYEEIRIAATIVSWRPNSFDALLRARADDEIGPLMFANFQRRTAFAPYDGGADLFLESPQLVPRRKQEWSAWLSTHPQGL